MFSYSSNFNVFDEKLPAIVDGLSGSKVFLVYRVIKLLCLIV